MLNPDGSINKNEALKEVPFVLKAPVGAAIDAINKLDVNHDGKADLVQVMPFVLKALPVIAAVAPHLDIPLLQKWFVEHDFVKDKAAVEAALKVVSDLATAGAKALSEVKK